MLCKPLDRIINLRVVEIIILRVYIHVCVCVYNTLNMYDSTKSIARTLNSIMRNIHRNFRIITTHTHTHTYIYIGRPLLRATRSFLFQGVGECVTPVTGLVYLPLTYTLKCWVLNKCVSSTIFWVFGKTRPGIERRSPGPLANVLIILNQQYLKL